MYVTRLALRTCQCRAAAIEMAQISNADEFISKLPRGSCSSDAEGNIPRSIVQSIVSRQPMIILLEGSRTKIRFPPSPDLAYLNQERQPRQRCVYWPLRHLRGGFEWPWVDLRPAKSEEREPSFADARTIRHIWDANTLRNLGGTMPEYKLVRGSIDMLKTFLRALGFLLLFIWLGTDFRRRRHIFQLHASRTFS
jgi:hypothetical protein